MTQVTQTSATSTPAAEHASQTRAQVRKRRLIEWGIVVLAAVIVAFGLRAFAFQAFFVPSGSMIPTLQVGDRIIVDKFLFDYHSLKTGDIVVFKRPARASVCGDVDGDLVKRVIATPGEKISSQNGVLYINGKALKQPWLAKGTAFGPPIVPETVPANQYFMMGDNRSVSCDSRYWGTIPGSSIVGRVVLLVWRNGHPAFHWF